MKWFLGNGSYYLWLALDDPDDWSTDGHTATYRNKLTMWTGNGSWFFDGRPSDGTGEFTGYFERHLLWWKYKRMLQNQAACTIAKLMTGGSK